MLYKNKILSAIVTLFIGIMFMFTATAVHAQGMSQNQGAIITGKVVDAETGQPVTGITIEIEGSDRTTDTNQKGMFSFSELQPGAHTITIEAEGYEKLTKEVDVNERGKNLNIELQPAG